VDLASGRAETLDDEENFDVDYYFTNNSIMISKEILPLIKYKLTVSSGSKDYATSEDGLDNSKLTVKNALAFREEDERALRSSEIYVDWQNKTFSEISDLDYSKTRLGAMTSYKEKGSYKLSCFASAVNFSYLTSSVESENVFDGKIACEKYLFDETLTLNCYSRATSSTRAHFGTQLINSAGAALELPFTNFSEVSASLTAGLRNSRMDEDYEEDLNYDYHFTEFNLGSVHPLTERSSVSPFYAAFEKTYTGGSYNSSGFVTGASFRYSPFENLYSGFDYTYTEKEYPNIDSLSHFKDKYSVFATYRIRKEWGVTGTISEGYYQFPSSDRKDRIESLVSLRVDKYLMENIQAYLNGEYRVEDYFHASDLNLSKWKLGADFKW